MTLLSLFSSAALLVLSAPLDDPKLEGKWICVKAERDGEAAEGPVGSTILLSNGKITIHDKKANKDETGTYKLDDTKNPKQITLVPDDPSAAGAKEFLCAYELKDNQLSLCMSGPGGERPTELTTSADSMRVLMVFKRDQPADDK